jgi:hypothetical protein
MALIHFLLVYDLQQQKLIHEEAFDDPHEAATAYGEMEAQNRGNRNVEIVLVGADSIETIRRTHGHYFDGGAPTEGASPFLTGV